MNAAAFLLVKAKPILSPKAKVVLVETHADPLVASTLMARAKIALDFGKQKPSFQLEAMVDGWDIERIKRELY